LERLVDCPSIDGHWIQDFISQVSRTNPRTVLEFLIARITRDAADTTPGYHPMPYEWDERSPLHFRAAPEFPKYLKIVREWLLTLDSSRMGYWEPKLYAVVAAIFDDVVISDLAPWVDSRDPATLSLVASLLAEAPSTFVFSHQGFVVQLLDTAAATGTETLRQTKSALWRSAVSGVRQGTPGTPFPEDENRRDLAAAALSYLSKGSPPWVFYEELREDAASDIRRGLQRDEELAETQ